MKIQIISKTVKGFTTMELSIVMLMAGLIAGMAYGGYSLFVKQFHRYAHSTENALNNQQLVNLMKRDIDQCKTLYSNGTVMECANEKNPVVYTFDNENYILRTQAGQTDTFAVELVSYRFSFQHENCCHEKSVIDAINFTANYQKMEFTAGFDKTYSNKERMEFNEQYGH